MPVNDLILIRAGTSDQWSAANPVLQNGEPGYDATLQRIKFGNGSTAWNSLPWSGPIGISGLNISPFSGVFSNLSNVSGNALLHVYSSISGTTLFNAEGTNGSLFSVTDNLSGSLMSVNNNAGLPVFEVFSDDRVISGRFNQNDLVLASGGQIGIGVYNSGTQKLYVVGPSTFSGLFTGTSGNFINSLSVNNIPVSVSGHTHASSQITDFNSSVSGLLPSVSGSGYVQSIFSDNRHIISVNGLQPSGNYSLVGHSHLVSDISNFGSGVSGLIPVKDILAGSGIQIGSTSGIYTVTAYGVAASSASSLITRCENRTGSTLPKMTVVYINGGHGNRPTIQKSIASSEGGSSKTYGITASQINNNSAGDVVVFGELIDVNTDQFGVVEGSTLYLSPSVSGNLTAIKPTAPNHMVAVGKIVRNHVNQGIIEVSIQNGFELEELHNVATTGAISGQFLKYDGSLWRNSGITSSDISNFNSSVSGLLTPYAQLDDATFNTLNVDTLFTCNTTNFSVDGDGNTVIGGGSELVYVIVPNMIVAYGLSFASGTASSGLNVFNYLTLNNTGVSLSGHTHLVSDISNFGSGVSGMLPVKELLPGTNVTITSTSGIYTINASGGGGGSSVFISDPGSGRVLVSDGTSSGIIGQNGLTFSNNSLFINGVNVNNGKNLFLWSTYR